MGPPVLADALAWLFEQPKLSRLLPHLVFVPAQEASGLRLGDRAARENSQKKPRQVTGLSQRMRACPEGGKPTETLPQKRLQRVGVT